MSKNYNGKLNIDVSGYNKALNEAKAKLKLLISEFKLSKEQISAFKTATEKIKEL